MTCKVCSSGRLRPNFPSLRRLRLHWWRNWLASSLLKISGLSMVPCRKLLGCFFKAIEFKFFTRAITVSFSQVFLQKKKKKKKTISLVLYSEFPCNLHFNCYHLVMIGGGRFAHIVATAAAKRLTPITLEPGGKSPRHIWPRLRPQNGCQTYPMGQSSQRRSNLRSSSRSTSFSRHIRAGIERSF